MKTLFLILIIALSSNLMAEGYNATKAHEDSLFIYNVYKDQIQFLENATKASKYQEWYNRSNHDDSITTCAKVRLKKWNRKDLEMTEVREFEGFGTAYNYPSPQTAQTKAAPVAQLTETRISTPVASTKTYVPVTATIRAAEPCCDKTIKFSITDVQTKFITRPDGKTKVPYVEKINYDSRGMIVSVEQLYAMATN